MPEHKGEPIHRWDVQPLRELAADVPVPFVVQPVTHGQMSVQLSMADTVTIDAEGVVRNRFGTPIFRLERA